MRERPRIQIGSHHIGHAPIVTKEEMKKSERYVETTYSLVLYKREHRNEPTIFITDDKVYDLNGKMLYAVLFDFPRSGGVELRYTLEEKIELPALIKKEFGIDVLSVGFHVLTFEEFYRL